MDLVIFENWVKENQTNFVHHGYESQYLGSPTDISNPSARLDLDSDKYIARITVWESGDCQLEIIEVESETSSMDHHMTIGEDYDLGKEFADFMDMLLSG